MLPDGELEQRVTICIAAVCADASGDGVNLIMCSDWRASGALGRFDLKLKQAHLSDTWSCLMAGHDDEAQMVVPIFRRRFNATPTDETNIVDTVRDSLN